MSRFALRIKDVHGNNHFMLIDHDELKKLFSYLWKIVIFQDLDKQEKKILVKNFLRETLLDIDKLFIDKELRSQFLTLFGIIEQLTKTRKQIPLEEVALYYGRPIGELQMRLIRLAFDALGWLEADKNSISDYPDERVAVWYKPVSLEEEELQALNRASIDANKEEEVEVEEEEEEEVEEEKEEGGIDKARDTVT